MIPGEILDRLPGSYQVLEAGRLPYPLLIHLPTVVTGVEGAGQAAEVKRALLRLLPEETHAIVAGEGGVEEVELGAWETSSVDSSVQLYLEPDPVGWPGLVATVLRLRAECPWDARQTHHSLARHLIEEAYETVDAIEALPAQGVDPEHYLALRGELGDLLLQAVFHATLARETAAFDVEEVAEGTRRKLVRRHPHVFGEVEVSGPEEVIRNWERLKQEEEGRQSLMDDVSGGLPALVRAAKVQRRAASVGFDWPEAQAVLEKVGEELAELEEVLGEAGRTEEELGDLLFSMVNLSRHLHVDPEMALRRATERFAERFRTMEREGSLQGLTLEELDQRWDQAKEREKTDGE